MDITLVTSSFDKVVHGTENDKKTGCGINLLRPENVTRFHRTSRMRDLKEITCEKCKASLAKKMIKADKKEMALLLKEEKKREKMGIGDEGIVPLGNTTARITRDPDAKRKEEEARRQAAEEARRKADEARRAAQQNAPQAPEPPVNTIPGTGVAMDASLAQFAINAPQNEPEPAPAPAPAPMAAPAAEDDFLAQFAINKPGSEPEAAPAAQRPEDDFLAQFAIPAPQAEEPVPEPVVQPQTEEDIMQMFSINNALVQEQPYGEPLYSQPPVYGGEPQYIDAEGRELTGVEPVYNGIPQTIDDGQEIIQGSEWDFVANQLFGSDGAVQPVAEPVMADPVIADPAPVYPQYDENLPKEMDELDIPSMGNMAAPVLDEIPTVENITAPVLDEIPTVEDITAPVLDEIPTVEDITAPVLDEIPTVEDIAAPVLDEIPTVEDIAAPVLDEIPTVEDIAAPVLDEMPAFEDIAAPVLDSIPTVENITAPVLDDIAEPVFNEPLMAEEEFTDMSDYNYVAPGRSADENTENAEQPRQAAPQQPQIIKVPQLAGYDANNQPIYKYIQMKLAGYDQKGQPVYVPLQAAAARPQQQAAAPKAQPQQAAAPAQQTAAQAQRAAAAPVQPAAPVQQAAPVNSPVPKKPVQQSGVPKANISQIAVNPHSKQTSQAFINAISSSKEYADKNLIETQGLKANSPILTSVEDVLSTMGDDTVKRQKAVQTQQAVPVFEEYKAPTRNTYRGGGSSPKMHRLVEKDVRYMTKSELKAKKKQDKIDAKFRKEMSKRGF